MPVLDENGKKTFVSARGSGPSMAVRVLDLVAALGPQANLLEGLEITYVVGELGAREGYVKRSDIVSALAGQGRPDLITALNTL